MCQRVGDMVHRHACPEGSTAYELKIPTAATYPSVDPFPHLHTHPPCRQLALPVTRMPGPDGQVYLQLGTHRFVAGYEERNIALKVSGSSAWCTDGAGCCMDRALVACQP